MTAKLAAATIIYIAGLTICAPSAAIPWVFGLCAGFATASYGLAVYNAYDTYSTDVENCNLRYGG